MVKQLNIIMLLLLLLIVFPHSHAYSLEKLSRSQMKDVVAQSGISINVAQAILYNSEDYIEFANPKDPDHSYIAFGDIRALTTASCGMTDVNGDDFYGHLSLDVFTENDSLSPIYGQTFFAMKAEDLELNIDMDIGEVNYCGTDIGSVKIDDFNVSSFHAYMGAHGSGIDAEIGFASRTELFEFQYNDAPTLPDTGKLAITGTTFAKEFTGSEATIDDPSTWAPEGEFTIGDIENGKPVVIDIGQSTDNTTVHLSLQVGAIEGSLRVENINFGGNDVGHIIMDGINITKFDMEFPGRGLGRP